MTVEARARAMRKTLTRAEARLWSDRKRVPFSGTHFRRQVVIGPYIADFACHRAKLVIEVDGQSHSHDRAIKKDAIRTAFLEREGYRVLRVTNDDVYRNATDIIHAVLVEMGMDHDTPARPTR